MERLWRALAVAIALLLLLTFIDRFILIELLLRRLALPAVMALAVALASIGIGHFARRRQSGIALDLVVGYPIFGAICFLLGCASVNLLTICLPLVAGIAAGAPALRRAWQERTTSTTIPQPGEWLAFGCVLVVGLCAFVAAQAPPSTLDELAYHLAVPHTWVAEGRAVDLPLISHSYFPLGVESADLPPLSILGTAAGGIASHLMHLIAAMAAAVLIQRRTRNLVVTAAIVATPALALTAGWSLVDWPLLGICVALLEEDIPTQTAALAAGLLTKYTFIPIAILVLAFARVEGQRRLARFLALWPGLLVGSVFFVRNLLLTGNPIAPFLSPNAPHVSGYRSLTLGSYVFDGHFIDESLGAALLALLPAIGGILAVGLLIAGALLWASAPSARLLVPYFALAGTFARLDRSRVLRAIILAAVVAQTMLVVYFTHRTGAFSLIAATVGEDQYLAATRPAAATARAIDSALPAGSRTLIVGLDETYWFEHRVRGGGNFDAERMSAYLDTPTSEALRSQLQHDGITHVAVVASAVPPTVEERKLAERSTALTPSAQRSLAQLLDRYAAAVTSTPNGVVFALK